MKPFARAAVGSTLGWVHWGETTQRGFLRCCAISLLWRGEWGQGLNRGCG